MCRGTDLIRYLTADAGINGHLSKPIVMDKVVKTIVRNLDH